MINDDGVHSGLNPFKEFVETPFFARLYVLPNMPGMQSLKTIQFFFVKEQCRSTVWLLHHN